MKISDAINILNIKNYTVYNIDNISYNELKKHYHIQCLIYHPDKNTNITNTTNTTLIFQNINCAFNTLKDLIHNISFDSVIDDTDSCNDDDSYNNLLVNFINYVINYYNNSNNLNNNSLDDLKIEADKHLIKFLETFFSNFSLLILETIYLALLKFNNNNNNNNNNSSFLQTKVVTIIKKIIVSILETNAIYIIHPTISNMLNSDIYKLTIDNDYVYVPLWHNELSFENAIIKIYPILDANITLDNTNSIHYTYKNKFSTLLENIASDINSIVVNIDNNHFTINISNLKMTKYQTYILENQGIPKINSANILDNSVKNSIIFHIHLE